MADYTSRSRTNYFEIKNEEKFRELCKGLRSTAVISIKIKEHEGHTYACIKSCGDFWFAEIDEHVESLEVFFEKMQEIIDEDDAMLWTEIGYEKTRYLVGKMTIVTSNAIQVISLDTYGKKLAREMLDNPDWDTVNEY